MMYKTAITTVLLALLMSGCVTTEEDIEGLESSSSSTQSSRYSSSSFSSMMSSSSLSSSSSMLSSSSMSSENSSAIESSSSSSENNSSSSSSENNSSSSSSEVAAASSSSESNSSSSSSENNSSSSSVQSSSSSSTSSVDSKYSLNDRGLYLYSEPKESDEYVLEQLSDSEFNALSPNNQLIVADKLLSTLFFGYTLPELQTKIGSGLFLSTLQEDMKHSVTDRGAVESYILDETKFRQDIVSYKPMMTILTRFYAMDRLDAYFYKNWISYILTQTIMFSPAYELNSSHIPNITRVYNRLFTMLDANNSMSYITYQHVISDDNWRRFRSPEDNGREMMEIFLFDENDSKVPLAGQALQNWSLDKDHDTLVIGLDENREPISLFDTTVTNGHDFYRELVKSDQFFVGVTKRLVNFFFLDASSLEKDSIINAIVSSNPQTFQDITTQILFSKKYLLGNSHAKGAEELFYSLAKKMHYRHNNLTFYNLTRNLSLMNQASMKYKLGKGERVPLDTVSFAYYYKYIREQILRKRSNNDKIDDYVSWSRYGWSDPFVAYENFNYDPSDEIASLDSLIGYLFKSTISRDATVDELKLFREHMSSEQDATQLVYNFDMFVTYENNATKQTLERERRKGYVAVLVLDYISRLDTLYLHQEVK